MTTYELALMEEIETADPSAPDWRESRAYRLWRIVVIQRDRKCVICGSKNGRAAHHVDHATYFIEKRFDQNNGVCLCGQCHLRYHNDFHQSTRHKCTEYDFMNFVKLAVHFHGVWIPPILELFEEDDKSTVAESVLFAQTFDSTSVEAAFVASGNVVDYVYKLKELREEI